MQSTREAIAPEPAPAPAPAPHSITALAVAMGFMRALETDYLYLFNAQELALARHFYQAGLQAIPEGDNKVLANRINAAPYRIQQGFFYVAISVGYDPIIMLRKLMIRNKIESAIQAGVKQVVYLGSGYDIRTLVASLAHPDVNFYEIDRGLTRESKVKAMTTIPAALGLNLQLTPVNPSLMKVNNNFQMIDCDLSVNDLGEVLKLHGFQSGVKTLIVAEGLTAYLSREDNQKLLASVFRLVKDGDELLLSYISDLMKSSVQEKATETTKEKLLFPLPANNVIPFCGENGFEVSRRFSAYDLLGSLGAYAASSYYWIFANKPKELYYLLAKSTHQIDCARHIDTVPVMENPLPQQRSSCQLL